MLTTSPPRVLMQRLGKEFKLASFKIPKAVHIEPNINALNQVGGRWAC